MEKVWNVLGDEKYRYRRFMLAVAFTVAGIVGLFQGLIADTQFVLLAGTVIGAYSWGINGEKK